MVTLGIILARAGSKGLPNKCVAPLCGRPLIEYTFDHALAATRLDALVLSTDSHAAQQLAARRGITTIQRPPELATDTARVDDAARHAVQAWEQQTARAVDAVAILYGNIPIRAAGSIDRCIALLAESGADSVRTVAPVSKQHPDWLHRLDDDGRLTQFRPNSIYRRQDLQPLYYHDGAVLAIRRPALFNDRTLHDPQALWGNDRRAIVQQPEDAVDVDTRLDLHVAAAILTARQAQANARV